jgi:hypothetical protein
MSVQTVNDLVRGLADIKPPDLARFGAALGAQFKQSDENEFWAFHQADLAGGPFASAEARLGKDGRRALVILTPREDAAVTEEELDLSGWGELKNLLANPRMPPEGSTTYVYDANGVKVSFEFMHTSERLLGVYLEWA